MPKGDRKKKKAASLVEDASSVEEAKVKKGKMPKGYQKKKVAAPATKKAKAKVPKKKAVASARQKTLESDEAPTDFQAKILAQLSRLEGVQKKKSIFAPVCAGCGDDDWFAKSMHAVKICTPCLTALGDRTF